MTTTQPGDTTGEPEQQTTIDQYDEGDAWMADEESAAEAKRQADAGEHPEAVNL